MGTFKLLKYILKEHMAPEALLSAVVNYSAAFKNDFIMKHFNCRFKSN